MCAQKALLSVRLQNKENVFLMTEYESDSKLSLKIINIKLNEAYVGQASDLQLRNQAASIRLTFSDFKDKITQALFENTRTCTDFLYCLDKKEDVHIFKWKSIDEEETIINLGNVEMKKQDYVFVFSEVLQSLSEEMQSLNEMVLHLTSELQNSKVEACEALKQLSVATEAKEISERELYSKFVLVLNEKKRKIQELQQCSNSHSSHSNHKKKKKSHILSDSGDEVDDDLDVNRPGPSKTTGRNSLSFFENSKPMPQKSQNRVRNRKIPANKNNNCGNELSNVKTVISDQNMNLDSQSDDDLLSNL